MGLKEQFATDEVVACLKNGGITRGHTRAFDPATKLALKVSEGSHTVDVPLEALRVLYYVERADLEPFATLNGASKTTRPPLSRGPRLDICFRNGERLRAHYESHLPGIGFWLHPEKPNTNCTRIFVPLAAPLWIERPQDPSRGTRSLPAPERDLSSEAPTPIPSLVPGEIDPYALPAIPTDDDPYALPVIPTDDDPYALPAIPTDDDPYALPVIPTDDDPYALPSIPIDDDAPTPTPDPYALQITSEPETPFDHNAETPLSDLIHSISALAGLQGHSAARPHRPDEAVTEPETAAYDPTEQDASYASLFEGQPVPRDSFDIFEAPPLWEEPPPVVDGSEASTFPENFGAPEDEGSLESLIAAMEAEMEKPREDELDELIFEAPVEADELSLMAVSEPRRVVPSVPPNPPLSADPVWMPEDGAWQESESSAPISEGASGWSRPGLPDWGDPWGGQPRTPSSEAPPPDVLSEPGFVSVPDLELDLERPPPPRSSVDKALADFLKESK